MAEPEEKQKKSEEEATLPLPILGLERSVSVSDGVSCQKTEWPELVGATAEEAQDKIKLDMAMVQIQVVPPDHFVTMDFNMQRVRLYLDASGKVARPPHIG